MRRLGYFVPFLVVLTLGSVLNSINIVAGQTKADLDFSSDGRVNLQDFSILAAAWLSLEGEPQFNEICDLDDSGQVEITDLQIVTGGWLSEGDSTYTGVQTEREKLNFNTGWKYYKGNPGATFEHVMLDEAGTFQGENNWFFGVSTTNTGPRAALMIYDQSWWNWMSCWCYPSDNSSCLISDDRFIPGDRPAHQYTMYARCNSSGGYIPRIEWVSPYPDNAGVQITFNVMSETDTQKVRILRNGILVWESPNCTVWNPTDFVVTLSDIDHDDILTFMQSAFISSSKVQWGYLTITETTEDLDGASAALFDDSSWGSVTLPYEPIGYRAYSTWPADTYRGILWYRKHFTLDSSCLGKKLSIEFESANVTADVWINGTHLTTHYGGFLPFMIDVTDHVYYDGAENIIAVKVNCFDQPDVPSQPAFGGINSDIWLHVTDKLHVTDAVHAGRVAGGGVFVSYPSVSDTTAQVQIKTHVMNEHTSSKNCTIETYIVDSENHIVEQINSSQTIAAEDDYTFSQSATIENPILWYPDHPCLYTVYTHVLDSDTAVDNYRTRIGIRSIFFSKSEGFKINGQSLRFRGANSNRGYPYVGCAVSNEARYRDLVQLKEEGFNYLRPSPEARPDDPGFLDACDELGLLLLDPIHSNDWHDTTLYKDRCYQAMRDLIRRDRNHPCVIAWELSLNEKWWDDPEFSPTAMSIGHGEYPGDQCYVAAWKDSGRWGGSEPVVFDVFIATPTAGAREYDGPLPLIISEHGHWEYRDWGADYDSDVRRGDGEAGMLAQAFNHQQSHNSNLALDNMVGDGVFCSTDYLAYPSGTIDIFRLPKFSYFFWQSQRDPAHSIAGLDSGPMVKIAGYWTSSSPDDVKVFSNCDQVKLYINDLLVGDQTPDVGTDCDHIAHPPFTFNSVSWSSGELKADGYIGGELVATDSVYTPGSATHLEMSYSSDLLNAGGDMMFVYVLVLDNNDIVVPNASPEVHLDISGPADLIGPVELEAESGIASFLIRTTDTAGNIIITATATGLSGDTDTISSQLSQ
ncbi:MAG: DUF4982 domain-containing protein [Sedimentisphaerales bacterium]|nr:DUF4982 domain-containing protein [Sedimentisphaerales bacterium]